MRSTRPKDTWRRTGPPTTEDSGRRHQQSSRRQLHDQSFFMDQHGNYPSTQEDGNWTIADGIRRHNRTEASRGRPSRGRAPTFPNGYNANRGRERNSEGKPVARALNKKDLMQILGMQSPSDVVQTLSNWAEMLKALLHEQKMNDDVIEILLRIFVRVFEYNESDKRKIAIDMVKDSTFFKSVLLSYTAQLGDNSKTNSPNEDQQKIEKKIDLLSMFLEGFIPGLECEINDFDIHITLLHVTSKALFEKRRLSKEALIKVARLKNEGDKCITEAKEEEKKRRQLASAIREGIFDGPPPDDYRDIPILPTKDDLHSTELPFLRPNKIKGSYSNHYHYLDVQFRLLREDFISPLRDGIQTHLTNIANPLPRDQRKRNTNVRLYYDVQIDHPVFSEKGVVYRVKFSLGNLTRVKWQNTKRLIFGSLVCLSHDNFQTLLFGTVSNREEELLSHGQVDLKLHNIENIENARIYTMVESTTFFESYRPVLQVLQQFDEESIPMENYIIRASHNIEQPKYLRNQPVLMYDISALMKNKLRTYGLQYPYGGQSRRLLNNDNTIDILDEHAWPKLDRLILDESQLSAVTAALTKELAVIQGPPGTGKTYIGLKIVQTLLLNKSFWSPAHDDNSPIMIICYTNHALDQFLEGILEFSPENLVRIGGRSKSEILANFNLKTLSRKYRRRPENFQQVIDSISEQMIRTEEMIKLCDKHILSEYALEHVINDKHFRCLQDSREEYSVDGMRSTLPRWLGLLSTSGELEKIEDVASGDEEVEEGEQDDVPNTRNIMTEVDMLLLQRECDDVSDRKDYETRNRLVMDALCSKLAYDPGMQCKDSPLKEKRTTMLKQLSIIDDEMTEHEANRHVNIRKLSLINRWRLYRYWIAKYKGTLRQVLFNQQHDYDRLVEKRVHQQDHEANCKVIRNADVIGMTTTGAAMNKELLNVVRPKIVIVEEAAEILEAHIVTSLTNQCEHLILIGDHQQLKPNPTVHKLATKFHLDTSLFERKLTNDVPCQKLTSQHRMRPEISNIMRRYFYKHLLDDESVTHFDDIKGVSQNFFFINHNFQEVSVEDSLSKSNVHEAEYCIALANYFFQQGYEASDITILTTYAGQVLNLKGILRNKKYACLNGIYVSAVDNYQGEENEIILLSLVRSNETGNIGFLKVSNRMCVALSRARKGLFCIGNFKLLAEKNDLWMKIVNDMRSSSRIGNHLQLYCRNHPKTTVEASVAKHFEQCPRGGCNLMCETRLECGHVCPIHCHPKDLHHEKYKCTEVCVRTCERGHPCYSRCFEECPPCKVSVKITLDCLHEVQCAKFNKYKTCTEPCDRPLQCGHECKRKCFEMCTSKCKEIVKKSFLPCGHDIQVKCYINSCQAPCEKLLTCGHGCKAKCGDRCTDKCTEVIVKTFGCGHTVKVPVPCFTSSCTMPCSRERVCGHPCPKLCGESCGICLVKVRKELACGHQKLVFCHEDVKSVTCRQMCSKTLSCGHQCKSICYQPCSSFQCRQMCSKTLSCGHQCKSICYQPCSSLPCRQMCSKTLSCGHQCKLICYQPCSVSSCTELVEKKLKCEHEKEVPCNVNPNLLYNRYMRSYEHLVNRVSLRDTYTFHKHIELIICNVEVNVIRKCGHEVTIECWESSKIEETRCLENVTETLSCGHDVTRECSEIGVCSEMCILLLPCGHKCKEPCAYECTYRCNEKVEKKLKCGHMKTVRCYVDVICNVEVNVTRKCGHEVTIECWESSKIEETKCLENVTEILSCGHDVTRECSEIGVCSEMCLRLLPCGHKCKEPCAYECTYRCNEKVEKKLKCGHMKTVRCYVDVICNVEVNVTRKCGHEVIIECWESSKIEETKCLENVTEILSCGHDVTRECSEIGVCSEMCLRLLPCGHKCKEPCANVCTYRCNKKAEKKLKCGHMKTVGCYVDVTEIVTRGEAACHFKKEVRLSCGHEETQLCCQSDLHVTCSNRCSKKLPCGHFCDKKCSQECSSDSCKQSCNTSLACCHVCKGKCIIL